MPMTISAADLLELRSKYKAGEPIDLEAAKDGFTIVIHKHELPELMKGTSAEGRIEVESFADGAIELRIVDPIKARVRLDEIRVQPDRICFNSNLSVLLRKPIELMLRAKGEKRIVLDGKRMIAKIPARVAERVELREIQVRKEGISVTGRLKQDF